MTEVKMDFGQEFLKCAAPDCTEVRYKPEDPAAPPFCEEHTRDLKFIRFVMANTPIRVVQEPARSGLTVPTVVPPKDPTGGLIRASR